MASKNFSNREQKKPKKGAKKENITSIVTPTPEVEVIKKVRKPKEEEEA